MPIQLWPDAARPGRDAADFRHRAVADPEHAAAAWPAPPGRASRRWCARRRTRSGLSGAGRGERGAGAVADAVEPASARSPASRCCARRLSGVKREARAVLPSGPVTVTGRSSGSSDWRVTIRRLPSTARAQIVLLEIGLLHQPIGERGAAARPAARRPRSRASTATSGRTAAAPRGPCRRGRAPGAARRDRRS